jgi:PEP-CTERM motif
LKVSTLVSAVALALTAQAASAAVVTVIIDDFSIAANAAANGRTPSFTSGSGTATIESDTLYPTSPFLNISVGALPTTGASFSLGYAGYALPTNATAGTVTFAALYNGVSGPVGSTTPNTVGLTSPTGTTLINVTDLVAATPVTTVGAYTGGAFAVLFNTPATRSWDILVDNVGASFNCSGVGAPTANVSVSLADYKASNYTCGAVVTTVPVPGSLALLGLGGLALGFAARRRSSK